MLSLSVLRQPGRVRRAFARVMLACFVYAQLAIAAYACPRLAPVVATPVPPCHAQVVDEDEPAAEGSVLCLEHCRAGDEVTDPGAQPVAPPLALAGFAPVIVVASLDAAKPDRWRAAERRRARAPPLAHALAHCCLRT